MPDETATASPSPEELKAAEKAKQEAADQQEERERSALRVELADRVRSYTKSVERLTPEVASLRVLLNRALKAKAITREEASRVRRDLKLKGE